MYWAAFISAQVLGIAILPLGNIHFGGLYLVPVLVSFVLLFPGNIVASLFPLARFSDFAGIVLIVLLNLLAWYAVEKWIKHLVKEKTLSWSKRRRRAKSEPPDMMRPLISIGLATLALYSAGCRENSVTRYATIQDAKKDRLFDRGWVPDVLPDTAGPLTEAHNIDTNARCALGEFPVGAFDEVVAALSRNGFERYDAIAPAPPLSSCPFGARDFQSASIVLRRSGVNGDREFAGISRSGTFIFMGMR
jgi:hypothetical protein